MASFITASSTLPKIRLKRRRLPKRAASVITADRIRVTNTSCPAALQAISGFFFPMNWADTTAPPVASAASICMISTLTESTKETPETAVSPTAATIITSTMPTSTANICSTIRGARSFNKSFLENIDYCSFLEASAEVWFFDSPDSPEAISPDVSPFAAGDSKNPP